MSYVLPLAIFAVLIFILSTISRKRISGKRLKQIQESWGRPKTESFDFDGIKSYAEKVRGNNYHVLSEQTIEDIDFYGLFAFIDRTTSKVGQQYLFRKLKEPANHLQDSSESLTQLFSRDKKTREEVQLEIGKLKESDAYYIPSLLQDNLLKKPKWFNLLKLDLAVVVILSILSFKYQVCLIILLFPFALNIFLHYRNKTSSFRFVRSVPQLNVLINVSGALLKNNHIFQEESVAKSIASLKRFQRKSVIIDFNNGNGIGSEISQVITYALELIKALFLVEVFALDDVVTEVESRRSSIITLFDYVGNIDAALSIASLRAGTVKTCHPVFTLPGKKVSVKKMYHPLIEDCVENDLEINDKGILITGSNMSGKSTFLRTFAINSILAQTIYTCFAEEFNSPVLKQYSSIRIDDDIFQGKSYFLQEVNTVGTLLAEVNFPEQNLFILDEIFRGTNTMERIAAAKAILSYLNLNNNIVMISTHDIELSDMLEGEYDLYHFTEEIEEGLLHFDHTIKSGPLRTRNAIKLLELSGYPAEIISEAKQLSMSIGIAAMPAVDPSHL